MSTHRITAAELLSTPHRWHGQRVRVDGVLLTIAFEGNAVFDYPGRGVHVWHSLGHPEYAEGQYRIDATGLFSAEPGRCYGHLGGWAAEWRIEQVHTMRPAGWSLAERLRAVVRSSGATAALSPVFPLGWPPSSGESTKVAIYELADPIACWIVGLDGVVRGPQPFPERFKPPAAGNQALDRICESLVLFAIEAGFISQPDLLIVGTLYRRWCAGLLRTRHRSFATWLEAPSG